MTKSNIKKSSNSNEDKKSKKNKLTLIELNENENENENENDNEIQTMIAHHNGEHYSYKFNNFMLIIRICFFGKSHKI
jgi:hypothetical protein